MHYGYVFFRNIDSLEHLALLWSCVTRCSSCEPYTRLFSELYICSHHWFCPSGSFLSLFDSSMHYLHVPLYLPYEVNDFGCYNFVKKGQGMASLRITSPKHRSYPFPYAVSQTGMAENPPGCTKNARRQRREGRAMDWLPRRSTEILPEPTKREVKAKLCGVPIHKMERVTRRACRLKKN